MANDLWATPQYVFDWLDDEFHFNFDVCATHENRKCTKYFCKELNALSMTWGGAINWMNPPYSDPYPWVKKAYEESQKGCTVVCLLPADISTKWFHEWVIGKAEVRFVQGRIKFVNPETGKDTDQAPKFGSLIAIYGPGIEPKVISVKRPDKPKRSA